MNFKFYPLYASAFTMILIYLAFFCVLYYFFIWPTMKKRRAIEHLKQDMMVPDINFSATVFSKALRTVKAGYGSRSIPYISFELQDGRRIDFETEMSDYVNLKEGDVGILTYKEKDGLRVFISFRREQ